jgi:hypothetical protein
LRVEDEAERHGSVAFDNMDMRCPPYQCAELERQRPRDRKT